MTAITIAPWPQSALNPYQELFYGALGRRFDIQSTSGLVINDDALRTRAETLDAVHLHWPEFAWRVHGNGIGRQLSLVVGLGRYLRLASRHGLVRLWTAHNVSPHAGRKIVDFLGYLTVARNSDLIIVHGDLVREDVLRRYRPRCPVIVMPHGNYVGVYPPPRPAAPLVKAIGLDPGKPLLACVGSIQAYKGFDVAIAAVQQLNDDTQLVIAGTSKDAAYTARLRAAIRPQDRIVLIERDLDLQEMSDLVNASEAVLLPYTRVTTSGVLLLAWSLGRGVVTTPQHCFERLLDRRPLAGRVAPDGTSQSFAQAVRDYLAVDASHRAAAAAQAAGEYSWDACVAPVGEQIRALVAGRRSLRHAARGA